MYILLHVNLKTIDLCEYSISHEKSKDLNFI